MVGISYRKLLRFCIVCLWSLAATGASARGADPDSASALLGAVREGDAARIEALLGEGAQPDARDHGYLDATALMLAAERDDIAAARLLLAAGAALDGRDRNGDTALNWAAYYGHRATVMLLLGAGADPSLTGHGNALDIARRRGFEELLEPLAARLGVVQPVPTPDQTVIDAVRGGEVAVVQRCLADDSRLAKATDRFGRSVLQLAAAAGSEDLATILLTAGADVDALDPIGFTPLMDAARGAHSAVVRLLLAAGADPLQRATESGLLMTPLHMAAVGGDLESCKILLTAGANIDVRGGAGNPPVMWALAEGHMDLAVALLNLGADADLVNEDGDSLRSVAQQWGIVALLDALEAREASGEPPSSSEEQ